MKFDKSKILTCVTADQARVGQKGWFEDNVEYLKEQVKKESPSILLEINSTFGEAFIKKGGMSWLLFYPAPEQSYRRFTDDELNDFVGKVVIQKHTGNAMLIIKVVDGETGKMVSLGGSQKRNAQQLLEGWTFKDGHPCGVKEEI